MNVCTKFHNNPSNREMSLTNKNVSIMVVLAKGLTISLIDRNSQIAPFSYLRGIVLIWPFSFSYNVAFPL